MRIRSEPARAARTHARTGAAAGRARPTWCAVMRAAGANAATTSAATCALLFPTWCFRNRNWRLRLLVSMVSRSTWWRGLQGGAWAGRARGAGAGGTARTARSGAARGDGARRRRTTSMSSKPESTRVLSSSQPMPPAPTTRTLAAWICGRSAREAQGGSWPRRPMPPGPQEPTLFCSSALPSTAGHWPSTAGGTPIAAAAAPEPDALVQPDATTCAPAAKPGFVCA